MVSEYKALEIGTSTRMARVENSNLCCKATKTGQYELFMNTLTAPLIQATETIQKKFKP